MERFTLIIDSLNELRESFEWMAAKIAADTISPLPQESAAMEKVLGETMQQAITLHQALMVSRVQKVQLN